MSWELMNRNSCGCSWYMDDWNRQRFDKCVECRKKDAEKWKQDSLERAKENDQCLDCTLRDRKHSYPGVRSFLVRGICKRHKELASKNVLSNFKLNNLDSETIKNSNEIRNLYNQEFPRNRGYNTKKFDDWVTKWKRKEISKAEAFVLKNQKFEG